MSDAECTVVVMAEGLTINSQKWKDMTTWGSSIWHVPQMRSEVQRKGESLVSGHALKKPTLSSGGSDHWIQS